MRNLILSTLILIGAGAASAHAQERRELFISPMGEPFRTLPDGFGPIDQWFTNADTDKDGALSLAEFQADAKRWFQKLDQRGDGEIDPDDIEFYETVLAPEIRVRDYSKPQREEDPDNPAQGRVAEKRVRQGAARYSFFDYPQPIVVADRNFNRGVDWSEFVTAANARFDLLDTNRDGKIQRSELPRLNLSTAPPSGGKRGDDKRRRARP